MHHWQPDPRDRITPAEAAHLTRWKPDPPTEWLCICGRPFTTKGGRTNHGRTCVWEVFRTEQLLAAFLAVTERARARNREARP